MVSQKRGKLGEQARCFSDWFKSVDSEALQQEINFCFCCINLHKPSETSKNQVGLFYPERRPREVCKPITGKLKSPQCELAKTEESSEWLDNTTQEPETQKEGVVVTPFLRKVNSRIPFSEWYCIECASAQQTNSAKWLPLYVVSSHPSFPPAEKEGIKLCFSLGRGQKILRQTEVSFSNVLELSNLFTHSHVYRPGNKHQLVLLHVQ